MAGRSLVFNGSNNSINGPLFEQQNKAVALPC